MEQDLDGISGAGIKPSRWKPRALGFQPYNPMQSPMLQSFVSPSLCVRLTKFIVETYQSCNASFTYSDTFNPKRYLTNPSTGVSNNGLDNKNADLILAVNGILYSSSHRYVVKEMLGQGTFGQVVKCWSDHEAGYVAVKVIKNLPAYYQQAKVEIEILKFLNQKFDPDNRHHIVRIYDWFKFEQHLCIAFELLSHNLYDLIKVNRHRGISLHLLRIFTKQILDSLAVLRDAGVIHCDLKPENILLSTSLKSGEIKLIDFGSACLEDSTVYKYIQSRFYRSPEVVLGHPYTTAIDMWSFGCVAAELFLGLPLFAGESEYDLLRRMIETLGCQPPDQLLRDSSNTNKYFKTVSAAPPSANGGPPVYQFLTAAEVKARESKEPVVGKSYFKYTTLEEIISNYPYKSSMSAEDQEAERQGRLSFLDFLRGLVRFDPKTRWTPHQASQHPFVTEQAFTGPFEPLPETPRTPVLPGLTVEHNPGAGHWFAAGLSPQVSHMSAPPPPQYSPQYYQFSVASSYGSCGSYGSCDGYGMPGSYAGSYTDVSNMYCNYPTPPQVGYEQWRRLQPPIAAAGYGQLGRSPSSTVFTPMSLGGSPSQFTPPGSQFPSPGSSPGRYGPPSPARYGKAMGAYKQRRGFPPLNQSPGYDGSWPHMQPNGSFEAYGGHPEAGSYSRPQSHLRHGMKSSSYKAGSLASYLSTSETIAEAPEAHQDSGDWFPNDSRDLLEEDSGHRQQQQHATGGKARVIPGHGVPGYAPYHGKAARLNEPPQHFHHSPSSSSTMHHDDSINHRPPFASPPSRLNHQHNAQYQRQKLQQQQHQQQHYHHQQQQQQQHYQQQYPQQQHPQQQSPDLHSIYQQQPGYPHSYTGFIGGSYPRPPVSSEQVERQLAGVVL